MSLGARPRTQANETTFDTSRICRALPAAWTSSCGLHGSGTRMLIGWASRPDGAGRRGTGRHHHVLADLPAQVSQAPSHMASPAGSARPTHIQRRTSCRFGRLRAGLLRGVAVQKSSGLWCPGARRPCWESGCVYHRVQPVMAGQRFCQAGLDGPRLRDTEVADGGSWECSRPLSTDAWSPGRYHNH